MSTQSKLRSRKVFARSLLSTLVALSVSGSVFAQDDNIEEVIVTGSIQANIRNALEIKRNADVVVDGISAEDIGSFPSRDMGEALQLIPGVQLDREGERRESSVSVRGLPGGMVKTTANGVSIASPTRNRTSIFGGASPYGAFDPAIFSGITVVKSQKAEYEEGGIAAVVDLQVPKALNKNNEASVTLGGRYEALPEELNPELILSGAYHIDDDRWAVAGTLAFSQQNFRQDTIKTNRYDEIGAGRYTPVAGQPATYDEWKTSQGIPVDATVLIGSELRQASEINEGTRISFAGNTQYQFNDQLRVGGSVIYTERDMDDNRYEQIELRLRDYSQVDITPSLTVAPRNTGLKNADDTQIWTLGEYDFNDTRYYYDNRQYNFYQQAQAVILDAEWDNDEWIFDGNIVTSSAENTWDEVLISPRAERPYKDGFDIGGPESQAISRGTEVSGTWHNGYGDIDRYRVDVNSFDQAIDFDGTTNVPPDNNNAWVWGMRNTVTGSGTIPETGRQRGFLLMTGTFEQMKRDLNSIELNGERLFDELRNLDGIQFGMRYASETSEADRKRASGAGIDLDRGDNPIWTNSVRTAPAANSDFFGGILNDYADVNDGWYSFDLDAISSAMVATIPDVVPPGAGETARRLPSGYIARAGDLNQGYLFDTTLDTLAFYIQADMSAEFKNGMLLTGNAGVRVIESTQEASAPVFGKVDGIFTQQGTVDTDSTYRHTLPSLNLKLAPNDDLSIRFAYGKALSRPNLQAAPPQTALSISGDGSEVGVTLPGTSVEPFTAKNYDLSVEWYNRESSSVTLAYFRKEIEGYYEKVPAGCSSNGIGFDIGGLSVNGAGDCVSDGSDQFTPVEVIEPGAEVQIVQWVNTDQTITIDGFELSATQNLDFLPEPWNGFGGQFNYTDQNQKSDTSGGRDPLFIPGVSDNSMNFIAYFEREAWGVRFSYNKRSDYKVQTNNTLFGTGVRTVKGVGLLDMSAHYNINDNLTLRFKGFNLTENIYEEYQDVEFMPRAQNFEGRTWVFSGTYKF